MSESSEKITTNRSKWDRRSGTYDSKTFDFMRWLQRKAISYVDLKAGINFLDVGCGTGWAVRYVASMTEGVGQFYGIDLSPKMIERAQAAYADAKNIKFLVANAERLPFDGDMFDTIICTNSFHHYPNPSAALSEMSRVIKPHGRLFILDLTSDGPLTWLLDKLLRRREPGHVKFYGTKEYKDLFVRSGLKHIKAESVALSMKMHIGEK